MPNRSHITQIMQNYFDHTDVRARKNPTSIEAQLLNLAGFQLEALDLRITRENNLFLQNVPVNIDNRGIYYGGIVPSSMLTGPVQTTFNNVVGRLGSTDMVLTPYDDTLPVPSRILVDSTTKPVPMLNPVIMDVVGAGDDISNTYAVQYATPGILPVPNKLTFWLDQIGLHIINATVTVTGQTYPQPAWVNEQKSTTELLTINNEGSAYTINRWASVTSIAVRNLPVGVRLRAWSLPFNLPAAADLARPYVTPEDRRVLYSRYWQIDNTNGWLNEMYEPGGFTELEVVNSYKLNNQMIDVAVEPSTNGLYLASGNTLYYGDRREYQPSLLQTGLAVEPLYGLQVSRDISKYGPTSYVLLQGTPYASAGSIAQYRYTVDDTNSILPNGALGPINAGWRKTAPQTVSFPLTSVRDYNFKLECQDTNGIITHDVLPFRNAQFTSLSTISLTNLVDVIKGIAFDSYGKLWVWNGRFAIQLNIAYDGYVFDSNTAKIYVTEPFNSLQIS